MHGTHEEIERSIARRKYPLTLQREGYCIPDGAEWKMMEYRVKREVLADFARDLRGINLNPTNNCTSLWQVLTGRTNTEFGHEGVPRRTLLLIRWLFKWANRLGVSPFKPVPVNLDKEIEHFDLHTGWRYHILLGTRDDPNEPLLNGDKHEDTL